MEDNAINALLFGILLLLFACIVAMYDDNMNYSLEPLSEQKDTMFNKYKRTY
jgi:hypothetical protein